MSDERVVWKAVIWGLGTWAIHCVAALVLVVVLVACVPRHTQLFDEFNADLPNATVLTISNSEFAVNYWYLIVFPLALDCILLVGWRIASPKVRWLASMWSWLVLVSAMLFIGFTVLTVSIPLERIKPATTALAGSEEPVSEAGELSASQPLPQSEPQPDTGR